MRRSAAGVALELCASKKDLYFGREIHARVVTSGWGDVFLAAKLAFMYGKCGCVSSAERVFEGMPRKSIFAWNALLGACASSEGHQKKAVEIYAGFRAAGVSPDACTLAAAVKSAVAAGDSLAVAEAHGMAVKLGHTSAAFLVNSVISSYAKCGRLESARRVFELLAEKDDPVSWNAVIAACVQNESWLEAVEYFKRMLESRLKLDSYTAVSALQACKFLSLLELGRLLHGVVTKSALTKETFVGNALIAMYAGCGEMDCSLSAFREMARKDVVSWNSVLSGCLLNRIHRDLVLLLHEMVVAGWEPDKVSLLCYILALGQLGEVGRGKEAHAYALRRSISFDVEVGNSLLDMYWRCSSTEQARRVFDSMPEKDRVTWTGIVSAYLQNNRELEAADAFRTAVAAGVEVDSVMMAAVPFCNSPRVVKEAHASAVRRGLLDLVLDNVLLDAYGSSGETAYAGRFFQRMVTRDVVSWTSVLNACTRGGDMAEAARLLYLLSRSGVRQDPAALVSALGVVGELSSLRKGKEVHGVAVRAAPADPTVVNVLADMYARCGDLGTCQKIFSCAEEKGVVLWTTFIAANGMHGRGAEAVGLFRKMREAGVEPDSVSFLAVLHACSHSGLVDQGIDFLEMMESEYGLEPWFEHYACVVDMLSRAGKEEEANELLTRRVAGLNRPVWSMLVKPEKLLELDPGRPGNYVMAANVFAGEGRWGEVERVRERMKGKGLRKSPGCSWIEIGEEVRTFVAGEEVDHITSYLELTFE